MAVMEIGTNTQEASYYFYPLKIVTEVYNSVCHHFDQLQTLFLFFQIF